MTEPDDDPNSQVLAPLFLIAVIINVSIGPLLQYYLAGNLRQWVSKLKDITNQAKKGIYKNRIEAIISIINNHNSEDLPILIEELLNCIIDVNRLNIKPLEIGELLQKDNNELKEYESDLNEKNDKIGKLKMRLKSQQKEYGNNLEIKNKHIEELNNNLKENQKEYESDLNEKNDKIGKLKMRLKSQQKEGVFSFKEDSNSMFTNKSSDDDQKKINLLPKSLN